MIDPSPLPSVPGLASLEARVRALEGKVVRARTIAAVLAVAVVAAGFVRAPASQAGDGAAADAKVLRVRRLVVEDEQGRPRVVLGAPVASVLGRRRTDPACGLVLLDEFGNDRLQVGVCGGPQIGGAVQQRIAAATGVMLCDLKGDERGGFGFLDNGRVVLGMDDPSGEGVMLYLAPDLRSRGLVMNEGRGGKTVQRLFFGVGEDGEALAKLHDGSGRERTQWLAPLAEMPQLLVQDDEGQELDDLFDR